MAASPPAGSGPDDLGAIDWTVWLHALLVFALLAGTFLVLRWLLLRHWHSRFALRAVWLGEVIALPLLILAARELLAGLEIGPRLALGIEVITGIALCIALAWLADRGIGLFLLKPAGEGSGRTIEMPRILRTGIRIGLYLLALIAAFTLVLEQNAVGFVVSGSVLLGVLGLALQGILQDAFAGVAISIDEPFQLGDWLELDDGTLGQVLDISWRATRLRSFDHGILIVPNHRMASARLHNYTQDDRRHALMLYVHLPNEIDPTMGRRLLLEAALSTSGVLREPAPVANLADGGTRPHRYLLYLYCEEFTAKFVVTSKVYESIWRHLRQLGLATAPTASDTWLYRASAQQVHEEDIERLIANTPLFEPLTEHERAALMTSVEYRVFPAECAVVCQGEAGDSLYMIAGGQLRVTVTRRGQSREVARLGGGEHFGEISLLTGAPRTATVATVTECTLLQIGKDALTPILSARPELGEALAAVEARRQIEMEQASGTGTPTDHDVNRRARQIVRLLRTFFRL